MRDLLLRARAAIKIPPKITFSSIEEAFLMTTATATATATTTPENSDLIG